MGIIYIGHGASLERAFDSVAHTVAHFPSIAVIAYLVQLENVGLFSTDGRDGTSDHR